MSFLPAMTGNGLSYHLYMYGDDLGDLPTFIGIYRDYHPNYHHSSFIDIPINPIVYSGINGIYRDLSHIYPQYPYCGIAWQP